MRVLVTGAAGFLGGHLVPTLTEAGHEPVALVRDSSRVPRAAHVVEHDLRRRVPRERIGAVEAVVHLAQANVPFPEAARELFEVNTASTQDLLDLAREREARFVFASSGSIYGLGEGRVDEDDPRRAGDFYAVTKRSAELLVEAYASELPGAVALRLFTPYGPGQRGRLIPRLIERVRTGAPIVLAGPQGRPRLTPIFVRDVTRGILAALGPDGHHVVNVAGDEVVGIRILAEEIGAAVGREPVFDEREDTSPGDLVAGNGRMKELLGLHDIVPLAHGLRATALEGAVR